MRLDLRYNNDTQILASKLSVSFGHVNKNGKGRLAYFWKSAKIFRYVPRI